MKEQYISIIISNTNSDKIKELLQNKDFKPLIDNSIKKMEEELEIPAEMANEFIQDLYKDVNETLKKLQSEIQNSNPQDIHKLLHSIKGSSGNLRFAVLYDIIYEAEQFAKHNQDDLLSDEDKKRLLKQYIETINIINHFIDTDFLKKGDAYTPLFDINELQKPQTVKEAPKVEEEKETSKEEVKEESQSFISKLINFFKSLFGGGK